MKVNDPYIWLEDLTAEPVIEWVQQRNAITQRRLEASPDFTELRDDLLAIYDSKEQIPYLKKHGQLFYNFWRDDAHERGVWRRTTLEEYEKTEPRWETVINLDELAESEGENWVWKDAYFLYPGQDRCLISLSRGGADATVVREFDVESKEFVANGFELPEAKQMISWIDRDLLYACTDFGNGSMTDSGYPRIVKEWKRGTPIEQAKTLFEGRSTDVMVGAAHDFTPGFERDILWRARSFFEVEYHLRQGEDLIRIDVQESARLHFFERYLLLSLREPWEVNGQTYPAGALLATPLDAYLSGSRNLEILFEPSNNVSLLSLITTRDHVFINVLDDVKNQIYLLTPKTSGWSKEPLKDAPSLGSLEVEAVDKCDGNDIFLTATDFINPTTYYHARAGQAPRKLKALPAFFDSKDLEVTQRFVKSKDGTRVPYFTIAPKNTRLDGTNPTLLTGYGGFEISLLPSYKPDVGRAWLSQGGVYVSANIRGGGEYGPHWHQAAIKEERPRAYEDFAAVARDLIDRGVTSPSRLGVRGGSNGGLLVGNMLTSYPELFGAVVCAVPLLDMKRYHLLLAGASWMAEYGNPDNPEEWAYIRSFSPYHNVKEGDKYPPVLFVTSTRDDRVHPGHARKMMALMEDQGHKVYYYENIEGGHGAAANNRQAAHLGTLAWTFLKEILFLSNDSQK